MDLLKRSSRPTPWCFMAVVVQHDLGCNQQLTMSHLTIWQKQFCPRRGTFIKFHLARRTRAFCIVAPVGHGKSERRDKSHAKCGLNRVSQTLWCESQVILMAEEVPLPSYITSPMSPLTRRGPFLLTYRCELYGNKQWPPSASCAHVTNINQIRMKQGRGNSTFGSPNSEETLPTFDYGCERQTSRTACFFEINSHLQLEVDLHRRQCHLDIYYHTRKVNK